MINGHIDEVMSDEDIVRALECCLLTYGKKCEECPYEKHKPYAISTKTCSDKMRKDLLSLVNRQKVEIGILIRKHDTLRDEIAEKDMEIEELENYNKSLIKATTHIFNNLLDEIDKAKVEAIKEFAERLCEERVSNDPVVIAVKVELNELTERERGGEK